MKDRILVAGGGGGVGGCTWSGGSGGGRIAGKGANGQTIHGDRCGKKGYKGYTDGGGGGAGIYIYSEGWNGAGGGGGGGSSYVERSATKVRFWQGWKNATGNGLLIISWQ